MHELVEWIGIVLIVICILGRTWTSLYISGRKIGAGRIGRYSVSAIRSYVFDLGRGSAVRSSAASGRGDLRSDRIGGLLRGHLREEAAPNFTARLCRFTREFRVHSQPQSGVTPP